MQMEMLRILALQDRRIQILERAGCEGALALRAYESGFVQAAQATVEHFHALRVEEAALGEQVQELKAKLNEELAAAGVNVEGGKI